MIEHYGRIVALDGSEYHYGDFKESRQEAVAKATARDQAILAVRAQKKGRPLTVRESLEAATQEEMPPSKSAGDTAKPSPSEAGFTLPYPLSAPARELTAAEESAKKTFQEMLLAGARAQQAKKTPQ
jgi:hypothetical protein